MNLQKTNQNAITLVALVITIIVLLVLAGISIQLITNKGILEQSKQAEIENKRAQIIEWLNLKLIEEQANNPLGTAGEIIGATRQNIEKNQIDLKKMGQEVNIDKEISNEEEGEKNNIYFYVIVDEDVYKVELNSAKFIGKVSDLKPIIELENIDNTTSTITVQVSAERNEGGEIEYYIKEENEEDYGKPKEKTTETSYTFTELKQNKKYNVKIVAVAKNKQTAEILVDRITGSVPDLTESDITFTYSVDGQPIDKNTWTNESVKVTVSTTVAGYTLQTSKDGETWESTDSQIFTQNGTILARLWDGTNSGLASSGNVTNIDTAKPVGTISADSNSKSITVKVTANDIEATSTNGCSEIKGYYYSINNGTSYTNITSNDSYTFNGLTQGTTYYIKVKVEDNAGNILELGTTKETLVITLALSSTSGTVVDGASQTATISGSNYGTLSVTSSDASIATASISGNTLTVTGTITSGTNNATITVAGSEGVSATYTVTAHKHTGDSTSGGGCYTKATTRSYSYECSGCREESYEYKCSGCEVASEECVRYDEETGRCTGWSRQMYCPGHEGTRTYCPGHIGYTTTYSMECGF